jgi:hypothetical protein
VGIHGTAHSPRCFAGERLCDVLVYFLNVYSQSTHIRPIWTLKTQCKKWPVFLCSVLFCSVLFCSALASFFLVCFPPLTMPEPVSRNWTDDVELEAASGCKTPQN